ncbi:DUF1294 domain-containing protein [Dielma fastidiosa]|uniref:DUF1294 domain-containing protein n=1 Tax=Dielma fastidiosa TaxID=1034346 RepID=UPI0023F352D4|nr:DUF1294 domain-containing protein [Dielma fastidiosa]
MKIFLIYCLLINIAAFFAMGWDKRCAIQHKQRIPEKTLFILAIIGGSLGSILAMIVFHHKNRKPKFLIGFPVIFVLQVVLLYKLLS